MNDAQQFARVVVNGKKDEIIKKKHVQRIQTGQYVYQSRVDNESLTPAEER